MPKEDRKLYAYPELPADSPYQFEVIKKLAFPDVSRHPVIFTVPSTSRAKRMYGISMIYQDHALVLLTTTFCIVALTELLNCYYSLFSNPSPKLLVSIYNTMCASPLPQKFITPDPQLVPLLPQLMKLVLLPFRTVVYSASPAKSALSLLFLMSCIPGTVLECKGEETSSLAYPLNIDTKSYPIIPYLPVTMIDDIVGTEGFIIGTSSPVFKELTKDWDVVINLDEGKVLCPKDIAAVLSETREDRLMHIKLVAESERKAIVPMMETVMWYYDGLLNVIAPFSKKLSAVSWSEIERSPAGEYGIAFIKEWMASPIFQEWRERVVIDKALKHDIKHPCHSTNSGTAVHITETIASYLTKDWMVRGVVEVEGFTHSISQNSTTTSGNRVVIPDNQDTPHSDKQSEGEDKPQEETNKDATDITN